MKERVTNLRASSKQSLSSWFAMVLSVGLTLVAGILYGHYSQRWGAPADVVAAAKRLESMPMQLGPWQVAEELILDESVEEMLECSGYVNRRYVNRDSGQIVTMVITVGPPGPTAVHTPEICYSARAYKQQGRRQEVHFGEAPLTRDAFWGVTFKPSNPLASDLKVYYAWSAGKQWEASVSPRFEFAALPMLYKIQLAGAAESRSSAESEDACRNFLEEFLRADWELASS